MVVLDRVTHRDVLRAIREYDRLGPERFFSEQHQGRSHSQQLQTRWRGAHILHQRALVPRWPRSLARVRLPGFPAI